MQPQHDKPTQQTLAQTEILEHVHALYRLLEKPQKGNTEQEIIVQLQV